MHKFSLIQGGGKCDNCSVKGGEDCSNTSSVCSSTKNSVVHVNLLMLGGAWGYAPPSKFNFSISETVSGGIGDSVFREVYQ